jgi:hypothetical protein
MARIKLEPGQTPPTTGDLLGMINPVAMPSGAVMQPLMHAFDLVRRGNLGQAIHRAVDTFEHAPALQKTYRRLATNPEDKVVAERLAQGVDTDILRRAKEAYEAFMRFSGPDAKTKAVDEYVKNDMAKRSAAKTVQRQQMEKNIDMPGNFMGKSASSAEKTAVGGKR